MLGYWLPTLIAIALPSAQIVTTQSWAAPTQNMDRSPLTDLAGFKIYCRQSTVDPYTDVNSITINSPTITEYQISALSLPDGMNYCVLTAFNTAGAESPFSTEVNFTIQSGLAQVGEGVPLNTVPAAPTFMVR